MWYSLLLNKKVIGYSAAAALALWIIYSIHQHIYESGIKECQREAQDAQIEQAEQLRKIYAAQAEKLLSDKEEEHKAELSLAESKSKTEVKIKEVKSYVDKIVEVPAECDSLMLDIGGVLQQTTSAAIDSAGTPKAKDK